MPLSYRSSQQPMHAFDFEHLEAAEAAAKRAIARRQREEIAETVRRALFYASHADTKLHAGSFLFDFAELEEAELDASEWACFSEQKHSFIVKDARRQTAVDAPHWLPGKMSKLRTTATSKAKRTSHRHAVSSPSQAPENRWALLASFLLQSDDRGAGWHIQSFTRRQNEFKRRSIIRGKLEMRYRMIDRWGEAPADQKATMTKTSRYTAQSCQCHDHTKKPQADKHQAEVLPAAASRWGSLISALCGRHNLMVTLGDFALRRSSCRRRSASVQQVQQWKHLHGMASEASCRVEPRDFSFTLACHQQMVSRLGELSAHRQQERRWRKKWTGWANRWQLRSVIRAWGAFIAACRPARCEVDDPSHDNLCNAGIPSVSFGTSQVQDSYAASAASLGIDIATYRLLRQLEEREIVPEDYELLGSLHASVRSATLTREDLKSFPTEMYCSAQGEGDQNCTNRFGVDFWRLPTLPLDVEEGQQSEHREVDATTLHGPDYWRLRMPAVKKDADDEKSGEPSDCEVCTICCMELVDGDAVRRLNPCGHCFHRDCIDRWLLESSTKCPVDQQEVARTKRW